MSLNLLVIPSAAQEALGPFHCNGVLLAYVDLVSTRTHVFFSLKCFMCYFCTSCISESGREQQCS